MIYAPIYIPTLCRSEHFKRCIESLKKNSWAKFTDVYVGVDFPPSEKYIKGWKEICDYVDNGDFSEFNHFIVIKRKTNLGAALNSVELWKLIVEKYDRYIYAEDDVEFSPNFLEYMDKCLDEYEDDPDVVNVTGYSYPIEWKTSEGATCVKQNINVSMWGCGFWKKKETWVLPYLNSFGSVKDLPLVLKENRQNLMIDAAKKEYIECAGTWIKRNSFVGNRSDIGSRIYLAVAGKYCISPVLSKARNYGFDGSGEYCQNIMEEKNFGNTAGTYNYTQQPIDTANTFDFIPDTLHDYEENRKRLNAFDYRSTEQMARTRRLLWLMKNVSITAARIYSLLCVPYDYAPKVVKKLRKKLKG